MGIFDRFRKKQTKNEAERDPHEGMEPIGWDAITAAFDALYPQQKDPKHYGTIVSWELGGNDPLRGVSIYDGGDFWHFVSYGLSELFEKESDDPKQSGWGMEFTFRLAKDGLGDEELEIKGVVGILQALARMTFTKGEVFAPFEYVYTGQTAGIDVEQTSALTGFITVPDESAAGIDTPNGHLEFIQFVGVTDPELRSLIDKQITVQELYASLGSGVTNFQRTSVI